MQVPDSYRFNKINICNQKMKDEIKSATDDNDDVSKYFEPWQSQNQI